ncbi:hypothetical protein FRB90_001858 [Tulasnella sp. 427]|nr:hypothetical protein FRB90_001858 [Tulasnella sp. 427]
MSSPPASIKNIRVEPRVGIFWDYENCAAPANVPGYIVAEQIRNAAHQFGPVSVFKAYLELSTINITQKMINLRSELQSSGVSLTDCPRTSNRKDVVDKMLLVDMLAFAMDNPAPAVIMLISGDRDFVYAVSVLRHRKYDVVLVIPPQGAHITLRSQATVVLDWRFDIFREDNIPPNASTTAYSSIGSGERPDLSGRSTMSDPGKPSPASRGRRLSSAKPGTPDVEVPSIDAGTALIFGNPLEPPSTPPPRSHSFSEPYRSSLSSGVPPDVVGINDNALQTPISPPAYLSPRVKRAPTETPVPYLSGPAPTSSSSTPVPAAPDSMRMFSNLIEVLEEWRLMGNDKPLRSKIGAELVKKNPLLYQRAGVRNFTEYVTLAEKAGVVKMGFSEVPGREWIALSDAFKDKIYPVF